MRLPLALALLLCVAPLNAAPLGSATNPAPVSVGRTIICDTSEQAQRFVALRNGGSQAMQAFQLINREAEHARHGRPAHIIAKMNALVDQQVIGERTSRQHRSSVPAHKRRDMGVW